MTASGETLSYRRLRAPRESGTQLIEPPLEAAAALVADNQRRWSQQTHDSHGLSLAGLRERARAELLEAAWHYTSQYCDAARPQQVDRILMAGHQPSLFHTGVWFKNFVLGRLAQQQGAVAINLQIDSDTIKGASLRVPGGSIVAPTAHQIPLDEPSGEIPYEERPIVDAARFESFGSRAAEEISPLVPDPLLKDFWPHVVARGRATNHLGRALSQARHVVERDWGLSTLELPQSHVCALPSFHRFAVHLLAHLERFREIHNQALAEYRRANRVRSAHHPVPELERDGDWLEAPLWVWTSAEPRRRRLFATRQSGKLLLNDRAGWQTELPLRDDADQHDAVEALAELERSGIKLRTRALLTTLFARLVLCDAFLHGIGGAKYDELTDRILERFFGVDPPGFLIASATLHLPIPREPVADDGLRRMEHDLRALRYHPESYVEAAGVAAEAANLVAEKRRWLAVEPTRETARRRCHAIRRANENMQPLLADYRRELLVARDRLGLRLGAEAVLSSREYAFCLFPEKMLRDFMLEIPHNTS